MNRITYFFREVLRKQSIASALVSLSMLTAFAVMPVKASAATVDVNSGPALTAAISAAANGDVIRLTADINLAGQIWVDQKSITINLDHKWSLNVTNNGVAVNVRRGGELKLAGDDPGTHEFNVTANGGYRGVDASTGPGGNKVTVSNVTGSGGGVNAVGAGTVVTVNGNVTVTAAGWIGVNVADNAVVNVGGNVAGTAYAVYALNSADVTVKGNVTADIGIYAKFSTVTVQGNVTGGSSTVERGVQAVNDNVITVGGNVTGGINGVYAGSACTVTVGGKIRAVAAGGAGISATNAGGTVIRAGGDVEGILYGVNVENVKTVTVAGNIAATGAGGVGVKVSTAGSGTGVIPDVTVGGDVTAAAIGVQCGGAGMACTVTVDGEIKPSGSNFTTGYIQVNNTNKTKAQNEATSSKAGYLEYLNAGSKVWVKDPSATSNEAVADLSFAVFPNPTTGELHLKGYDPSCGNLYLFDASGRTAAVFNPVAGSDIITLDISRLPAGLYYLKAGDKAIKVIKN